MKTNCYIALVVQVPVEGDTAKEMKEDLENEIEMLTELINYEIKDQFAHPLEMDLKYDDNTGLILGGSRPNM